MGPPPSTQPMQAYQLEIKWTAAMKLVSLVHFERFFSSSLTTHSCLGDLHFVLLYNLIITQHKKIIRVRNKEEKNVFLRVDTTVLFPFSFVTFFCLFGFFHIFGDNEPDNVILHIATCIFLVQAGVVDTF